MSELQLAGKRVTRNSVLAATQKADRRELKTFTTQREVRRKKLFMKARSSLLQGDSARREVVREQILAAEKEAGEASGHVLTISGATLDDTPSCSCQWKGQGYWDGHDLAYEEWLWHLLCAGVAIKYPSALSSVK